MNYIALLKQIDGYAVLLGVVYGEMKGHRMTYNWCLAPDMSSLLFFDPQTGKEYGPAALDRLGFSPTFVLF